MRYKQKSHHHLKVCFIRRATCVTSPQCGFQALLQCGGHRHVRAWHWAPAELVEVGRGWHLDCSDNDFMIVEPSATMLMVMVVLFRLRPWGSSLSTCSTDCGAKIWQLMMCKIPCRSCGSASKTQKKAPTAGSRTTTGTLHTQHNNAFFTLCTGSSIRKARLSRPPP